MLTQTQVSQLYVVLLGRAADGSGNAYWQSSSSSMSSAATAILNTPESKIYFGVNLGSDQNFIEVVYLNTFGKTYAQDPVGIDYWVDLLTSGESRGGVVSAIITAIQQPINAGVYQDMFNNKVRVSNYCANLLYRAPITTIDDFVSYIIDVTHEESTVTAAKAAILKDSLATTTPTAALTVSGVNTTEIETVYSSLMKLAELTITSQYDEGRLVGSDFAQVLTAAITSAMQLSVSSVQEQPIKDAQVLDMKVKDFVMLAANEKDIELKAAQILLTQEQVTTEQDKQMAMIVETTLKENMNKADIGVKAAQELMINKQAVGEDVKGILMMRQTQAYDDNLKTKEAEIIGQTISMYAAGSGTVPEGMESGFKSAIEMINPGYTVFPPVTP